MKLNANELISRSTQNASRLLVLTTSSIIFIWWRELEPNFSILPFKTIAEADFYLACLAIVIFLSVSLVLNWYGDYMSYTKWFKSNEVRRPDVDSGSAPKGLMPILEGLELRLSELARCIEKAGQKPEGRDGDVTMAMAEQFQSIKGEVKRISEITDELYIDFRKVDLAAKLQIFIWYFLLPLAFAAFAIAICLCSLSNSLGQGM